MADSTPTLADRILEADDRPIEVVEVPEWEASVGVRGLRAIDAERFARKIGEDKNDVPDNVMAELLVRTLCDPETGNLLFGDKKAKALSEKASVVLRRLFEVAQRLSGLDSVEEAKKD